MKKQDLINLIRAHYDGDEEMFRSISNLFANDFFENGDQELGRAISALVSDSGAFVPQTYYDQSGSVSSSFFQRVNPSVIDKSRVFWPAAIYPDIAGMTNAIKRRNGVSKFLLYGKPGTGKTETVRAIANVAGCELWSVDFAALIDYRLGETIKNINDLFKQISGAKNRKKLIFLFDEIDTIALNRIDQNDLREMGRATSAFLKGLDELPEDVCLIATTNLYEQMDPALIRRFDFTVDFSRYTREDRIEVGVNIYNYTMGQYDDLEADPKLFQKILETAPYVPYPGELKTLLRTVIAFGGNDPWEYLRLFYKKLHGTSDLNEGDLVKQGFTIRQCATLIGLSKSAVSRRVNKNE